MIEALSAADGSVGWIATIGLNSPALFCHLSPEGYDARTRAHEYGGGTAWRARDVWFFSNGKDGRVYRIERGGEPRPVTPESAEPNALRYADGHRGIHTHALAERAKHDARAGEDGSLRPGENAPITPPVV